MIYFLILILFIIFDIISTKAIQNHCKEYYCNGELVRNWDADKMEVIYYITFVLKLISFIFGILYFLITQV